MKGFVLKEFLHIFRDYRTMIILFGMPVVQVLIFGFAITNEINSARIGVWDQARDTESRKVIQKIVSSGYFDLTTSIRSKKEIGQAFRAGKVKQMIVFPPNFSKDLETNSAVAIQIISDASDPNTATLLQNYTTGILNSYLLEKGQNEQAIKIETQTKMEYNPELRSVFMFVPGTITILLMLVSAMMTSISIAREKEMGTMEVLLVSPLKPAQIIVGKVLPYVLLSFINAVSVLILAFFVFKMPFRGSLFLLLSETILFILMALALGIFISTVSKTQQQALLLSMFALMLPTILLSGFIFPVENMPLALQYVSHVMPSKWFIIIIKNIMLKGLGLSYFLKETLILLGMTLFFVGLSVKKFKIRLE